MSRDFILERIRQTVDNVDEAVRQKTVAGRLRKPPTGILPSQPKAATGRVTRFMEKAEAAQASVIMTTRSGAAAAISDWLRAHNLPQTIRMGSDGRLKEIVASKKLPLTILEGPSDGQDETGLSHAECGISETGTLALLSGPDNPTTLGFLPANHIVLVRRSDILAHYEEIWPRLRKRFGKSNMPRSVNLVTGPSRSADIEQTLLLGAHGPVRLHVIIIRD